jgi:wobble nucleotide-excising tRNase
MIQSIHIAETASFAGAPEVLRDLSTFNYIFGSNGTGKTTVSRIIADEGAFPTCRVTWTGGTKLQPLVYNRDFVERNFDQSKELKGVFTLGEGNVETLNRIEAAKNELDGLANEIKSLTLSLQGDDGAGGKKGELAALEAELKQKCWAQKKKHETKLSRAFEGFRNDQEKFKRKVIQEWTSNVAAIKSLAELEERASTIFGASPSLENFLPTVDAVKIVEHESNSILAKRVIGKDDVNIAAMIKHLGNSDWVREGRAFYNTNDRVCPFCQQTTEEAFAKSLDDYFDATFETDSRAIDVLMDEYKTDAERLHRQMVSLADVPTEFLDVDALRAESVLLDSQIALNEQRLALKKREPSSPW